jgi:hypothetical protein
MEELLFMLICAMLYACGWLAWQALKLLWAFVLWITEPIRQEIAFRRMLEEEREKEERLLAAHQEARREIDQVVAECDRMHEEALAQAARQASPRRSGSRSGGI